MTDEKLIYATAGGERHDPLAVHRRLLFATGGLFNSHLADWTAPDDGDPKAQLAKAVAEEKIAAAVRHAFGWRPFADGGPVDRVVLDEVCRYLEWLDAKK